MKRIARPATIFAFVATVMLASLTQPGVHDARASGGVGGTISLGPAVGATIPVNTTAPTDPFFGFNIHVRAIPSHALSAVSVSATITGSIVNVSPICGTFTISSMEIAYGCVAVPTQNVTIGGLLASVTVAATGDGCVSVVLLRDTGPIAELYDTYTLNSSDITAQSVVVSATVGDVLIGAGTAADCDADADGYSDSAETTLGKDALTFCSIMRADVNNDSVVNSIDLAKVSQKFGVQPARWLRENQNADTAINSADLGLVAQRFGQHVSACP